MVLVMLIGLVALSLKEVLQVTASLLVPIVSLGPLKSNPLLQGQARK